MPGTETIALLILVLARLSGVFLLVPIPGLKSVPALPKILLTVALSVTLLPSIPALQAPVGGIAQLVLWLIGEFAFGLAVGLFVGLLTESLIFGLQSIAVQAGFAYASTIDPNSSADSGVLQALALITSNLLFFEFGGDAMVIRAFTRSLLVWPPGSGSPGWTAAGSIAGFGSSMLELGMRLALPIAALLLLADLSLALMARIQPQMQLLSLAFPIKLLGALAFIAILLPVAPVLYKAGLHQAVRHLERFIR